MGKEKCSQLCLCHKTVHATQDEGERVLNYRVAVSNDVYSTKVFHYLFSHSKTKSIAPRKGKLN